MSFLFFLIRDKRRVKPLWSEKSQSNDRCLRRVTLIQTLRPQPGDAPTPRSECPCTLPTGSAPSKRRAHPERIPSGWPADSTAIAF